MKQIRIDGTAYPLYTFNDPEHDAIITTEDLFREWSAMTEEEKNGDTFRDYLRRVVSDTLRGQTDLTLID